MRPLQVLALGMFLAFAFNAALASAQSYQVGISPVFMNMGTIERGETKLTSFNVITSSSEGFLVNVNVGPGSKSFFQTKSNRELYNEYSEEDASSWVRFMNNPVFIDRPTGDDVPGVKRTETVNFLVRVPEDAEPGYHLVELTPIPEAPGGSGTGVSIISSTKISILFRVPGEALRSGTLLDISSKPHGYRTKFNLIFQNNGTVTISAKSNDIRLYDSNRTLISKFKSNTDTLAPGEVKYLSGTISDRLEPGSYPVYSNVTYWTGHSAKESAVAVAKAVEPPTGRVVESGEFPWWLLIIIIIILISYVIYRYA